MMPINPWETQCCDLVMKGGIASGIVYPSAIYEIAKDFSFVGMGGTSAGAIAASIAAAAEYQRRTTGSMVGFEHLHMVPDELLGGKLFHLFRPDAETKKLFEFALKGIETQKSGGKLKKLMLYIKLARMLGKGGRGFKPLVDNNLGLCTGIGNGVWDPEEAKPGDVPPLVEWLCDLIDEAAGLDGDRPLTFSDLHQAPIPPELQSLFREGDRSIDFRAVTTCITLGRPFEFPWETKRFAFDPQEWSRLFPKRVIDHLVMVAEGIQTETRRQDGKLPLPDMKDLPLIVAVRMSLSFPVLFTMVPLYAVNFEKDPHRLQKVWFTDGGVTSNFPMHRFDALFPRWPTLGINLNYTDENGVPGRQNVDPDNLVYLSSRTADGHDHLRHEIAGPDAMPLDMMLGFAKGIFRSAQVWHDTGFLRLPGYKHRSVEIWLTNKEGGMNLNMSDDVIRRLKKRGTLAGELISSRFNDPESTDPLDWPGHRWARCRSGMEGLWEYLKKLEYNVGHPLPNDESLHEILDRDWDQMIGYKFDDVAKHQAAKRATSLLLELIRETSDLTEQHHPFVGGPRPEVTIGTRVPM